MAWLWGVLSSAYPQTYQVLTSTAIAQLFENSPSLTPPHHSAPYRLRHDDTHTLDLSWSLPDSGPQGRWLRRLQILRLQKEILAYLHDRRVAGDQLDF